MTFTAERIRPISAKQELVGNISPEIVRFIAERNPEIDKFYLVRYEVRVGGSFDTNDVALLFDEDFLDSGGSHTEVLELTRERALDSFVYFTIDALVSIKKLAQLAEASRLSWTEEYLRPDPEDNEENVSYEHSDPEFVDFTACAASCVKLQSGKVRHIPMLDFSLSSGNLDNLFKIVSVLKDAGDKGFVVDSGNSFHFWGSRVRSIRWYRHWLRSMQDPKSPFYELVDQGWVDHSLYQRVGFLRVAPSVWHKTKQPRIVAVV